MSSFSPVTMLWNGSETQILVKVTKPCFIRKWKPLPASVIPCSCFWSRLVAKEKIFFAFFQKLSLLGALHSICLEDFWNIYDEAVLSKVAGCSWFEWNFSEHSRLTDSYFCQHDWFFWVWRRTLNKLAVS